jgi:D-tyrosyl-tRNA(Tyr) deacylase
MRALVQRVSGAAVRVEGTEIARIGEGLCALVGVTHSDTADTARKLASKVWNLRILGPGIERSLAETGGGILVVSQFTLYADTSRGRRPSWSAAACPARAEPLVEAFCEALRGCGAQVAEGSFGAHMEVELVNDGPVTVMLEV